MLMQASSIMKDHPSPSPSNPQIISPHWEKLHILCADEAWRKWMLGKALENSPNNIYIMSRRESVKGLFAED